MSNIKRVLEELNGGSIATMLAELNDKSLLTHNVWHTTPYSFPTKGCTHCDEAVAMGIQDHADMEVLEDEEDFDV